MKEVNLDDQVHQEEDASEPAQNSSDEAPKLESEALATENGLQGLYAERQKKTLKRAASQSSNLEQAMARPVDKYKTSTRDLKKVVARVRVLEANLNVSNQAREALQTLENRST
eukprot:CAMPEP_0170487442 /NCGR_PEP_ID=MMETSP0208-20121228/6251_1 /TAXON_ID=197538 /ORGANISM="Strombidium inclinatum, Strain S3" /LENGTH=113 /DNA_ID=CAMNT_0010761725 /DNA_START=642 /DNA_END=983 /DNA_ORIENTATION=-